MGHAEPDAPDAPDAPDEAEELEEAEPSDAADRVVVSYPADLSAWGRDRLEAQSFRAYLLKVHGDASTGDVWEEFVDVGCCGSTLDVPLRVESIEGGSHLTPETDLEYAVRDACGIEGSWRVQSEGGPSQAE